MARYGTRPNDDEASAVAPAGEPARIAGARHGAHLHPRQLT
jgi:hypothetical protein